MTPTELWQLLYIIFLGVVSSLSFTCAIIDFEDKRYWNGWNDLLVGLAFLIIALKAI